MEYQVHVGFGFHVNCYHSYRGDTCDALGFGGDIRIIRHIIQVLDTWNHRGINVKGTWDFENAYSLETILPQYAPDIIADVKRRQKENGDENILMGYNNGAMSAMTEEEFLSSIELAVTNDKGSGLLDCFGGYEKIIRPQEVMFTPSEAGRYQQAGIEAVCLYYSCIPFDAFRTVIPQLEDEDAFNPLRYTYKDGEVTIMPTYSNSDIMDAGSLRYWVSDLHDKQQRGEIQRDVFLFINIDADSFLWEPMAVPGFLKKLPNFDGLNGLIAEIADLSFVTFDTPGGYLKKHPPVRDIFFGEDVADGNFSGYASWAEKPFNRQIWSRLERSRRYAEGKDETHRGAGYEERIRLLSTTHFGLASPVMNIVREEKALQLSEQMMCRDMNFTNQEKNSLLIGEEENVADSFLLIQLPLESTLFQMQLDVSSLKLQNVRALEIQVKGLISYTILPMDIKKDGMLQTVTVLGRVEKNIQQCTLRISCDSNLKNLTAVGEDSSQELLQEHLQELHNQDLCLMYQGAKQPVIVRENHDGTMSVQARLDSWITYDGVKIPFDKPQVQALELGGKGQGIRLAGEIHLPKELEAGWYCYDFVSSECVNGILLRSEVQYPYTLEDHEISSQASNLGRFSDVKWTETAPLELVLHESDQALVTKRNFMNDISQYEVADFWKAIPENDHMDSFNHQLTGGILCVHDEEQGILIAHARQILGSMAHCPMRLAGSRNNREISLNPFGHYYGKQRHYPTRGNGCVMDLYTATMPQARSIAPAYNGAYEQGLQLLALPEVMEDEKQLHDMEAFADGSICLQAQGEIHPFMGDNVHLHIANKKQDNEKELKAVASNGMGIGKTLHMAHSYLANMHHASKKLKALQHQQK